MKDCLGGKKIKLKRDLDNKSSNRPHFQMSVGVSVNWRGREFYVCDFAGNVWRKLPG